MRFIRIQVLFYFPRRNMFTSPWLTLAPSPFLLQNLPDFPYLEYQNRQEIYAELNDWYSGDKLVKFDIDQATGRRVELYPLRINPLKSTAEKHITILLGESMGAVESGGLPIKLNVIGKTTRNKAREKELEKILSQVLLDSNLGAALQQTATESQYLGGSVYCVDWIPADSRIGISTIKPQEFIGVVYGRDNWRLRNAWIVRPISYEEAVSLGVDHGEHTPYWYTEHWTEDEYAIRVNEVVLKVGGISLEGKNVFGVVPIVYIPHIRTNGFYGESMITDTVKGLIKEMNLRMADIGDAIAEDSHSLTYIKNVRGAVQVKKVGGVLTVYDLGSRQSIGTSEPDPAMESLQRQSASTPMIDFSDSLMKAYRREVNHPAVADGEDEGSQRSALTLTTRMWPLLSHVKMERQNYTDGFRVLLGIALKMMAVKNIAGITEADTDMNIFISWSPMLAKDRELLLQEIAIRREHSVGSQQHMIELLEDVQDVDEEIAMIHAEEKSKAEMNIAKKSTEQNNLQKPQTVDQKQSKSEKQN